MVSDMLHNKMVTLHIKLDIQHIHQIPHVTHKFAHNINESKYNDIYIAHIVDGSGHRANIFGCNLNEYRHMTFRIHFCPWNNFTDGTPYHGYI